MFEVRIKKIVVKNIQKMPIAAQKKMVNLVDDLRLKGPRRAEWPNFSKLDTENYHCHLNYKWVVCWHCKEKSKIIEVYYAGSRENAPY